MTTTTSEAITEGIRVQVECNYAPDRSQPMIGIYFFVYNITITNHNGEPIQLKSRQWVITDANQHIEEIRGAGVVGETPILHKEQKFTYSSGCMLRTPFGTMQGTYQMTRSSGESFDVDIAPFLLIMPNSIN